VLPWFLIVSRQPARFTPSHSSPRNLCALSVAVYPERSRRALYSSFLLSPTIDHEHPISRKILATKLFRISACFARFLCHLSPFRMNTSKSVSKQRTLCIFRINTFEKQGRGISVMVNQTPDEGCLSRATTGSRGISPILGEGIYPACPVPRREDYRDDGTFRTGRRGLSAWHSHSLVPSEVEGWLCSSTSHKSPVTRFRLRRV
jgi:hypothetical protein